MPDVNKEYMHFDTVVSKEYMHTDTVLLYLMVLKIFP